MICDSVKVMTLKGQGDSEVKLNGTIGFLDLKNIDLDANIVSLSALVEKVWSNTSFFLQNGSQHNEFEYISHSSCSKCVLVC